ncbi:MAG: SDR family NAD(P)-dependent oxidoreductase, partial [Mycobacterium sp.]
MRIDGTSAVVSGGASGLGEATARHLAGRGAMCMIIDRNAERGRSLAKELGEPARFVEADVAQDDEVAHAVELAAERGPLRVAVNCAGIGAAVRVVGRDGSPHDFATFERVLRVNLFGTFNVLRLAAAAMSKTEPLENNERGVIINTAS